MKEANENYPHLHHSCSIANHTVMVSDKKKIEVPLFTGMALTLILPFSNVLIYLLTVLSARFSCDIFVLCMHVSKAGQETVL